MRRKAAHACCVRRHRAGRVGPLAHLDDECEDLLQQQERHGGSKAVLREVGHGPHLRVTK